MKGRTVFAVFILAAFFTVPEAEAREVDHSDLVDLRERVNSQMSQVKSDMSSRIGDLREDVRRLRSDVREIKAEIEKMQRQAREKMTDVSERIEGRRD